MRSPFLFGAQLALGAITVIVAAGLATVPAGSARVFGIVAAIVVAAVGVILIRGLRRQAILVDGDRFGWRRGLTNKVIGWTDLDDVEVATTAQLSTSITRKHPDVILWTRVGGLRGGNAILLSSHGTREQLRDKPSITSIRMSRIVLKAITESSILR